jgi:putative flippase GtrA
MMGWQDTLALPGTQALIMAAVSSLFASYFFRAAWVLDDDERERREDTT